MQLIPVRLIDGTWEGLLSGWPGPDAPALSARHRDTAIPGPEVLAQGPGEWLVRLAVPRQAIAEGVQTLIIVGPDGTEALAAITLAGGDAVAQDLRAEIDLLRAELDLLKRAFRRHCVETAPPSG